MDKTIELVESYAVASTDNSVLGSSLKNIIEQLPVSVIIFDKNLCFLAASNRFFDESSLQKDNLHVQDHWYTLIPDMPIKWKAIHQRALNGEKVKCEEDLFYRQDGSVEWWKWDIAPWYQESKEIGGLILYVENITNKKQTEQELEKNIRSLEKVNNNLSKFAHICAHDLNQSLRTISLYAQIVQTDYKDNLDPSLKKYINRMIKTIEQMEGFISSTLDFSHSKDRNILMDNVCMEEVIENVMLVLKDEIVRKKAIINYKNLPVVNANKNLITQLMQNLIANSLKYSTKDRLPVIDITAADKGTFLLFSIHDNGMGIETKHLKKIFSEYKRLNPECQEGSGLGLHHCNKIIREHGGRIWATSTIKKGTTMFFTLSKASVEGIEDHGLLESQHRVSVSK